MQTKFLKSIVEHLTNKQSAAIVDLLVGKKDVNEFLISKKLGLTINQTRNILYKLSDFGLVSFIRKKDKRKGWYIYFWTLNVAKSLKLLEQRLKKQLQNLEQQLKSRTQKRYYLCQTCNIEVTEEAALLNDFICHECEEVFELMNNEEIIKKLEKEIIKTRRELEIVTQELTSEEEKLEKKKERKIKRVEAEKKAKRKKAREKRKKEKEKSKKKTNKKKTSNPKKKTKKKTSKKKASKKTKKKTKKSKKK